MPIIKAVDLAYGRLRAPDLDKEEEFLTHFGMVRADRTRTALYMRGTDPPHHIHVTELGEPKYVGIAFHAASMEDLEKLARTDGASPIEALDESGGGHRVRLKDPDGYQVEVVYGMQMLAPIPLERPHVNSGIDKTRRRGNLFRVDRGPSHVKRIGHFVVMSPNFEKMLGWYREMVGLRCSDEVYADEKTNIVGSFNRLDRGDDYVDHHAFFCIRGDKSGLNHLSFEAADIDDVMTGHEHLKGRGYEHMWGIGRHSLGSQVFDYWADPWGRVHEHWADTDVLNASTAPGLSGRNEINGPWGDPIPAKFMGHASP
ncbi:MAG: VOC family protein [Alphaproteobacteria bacterium]|nr:VOC family protein [Alphaproteobacteria bacterium]